MKLAQNADVRCRILFLQLIRLFTEKSAQSVGGIGRENQKKLFISRLKSRSKIENMSTFWIILLTALLTSLAQKFLNWLNDFVKSKAMESLEDLCTLALGQQCFALRLTKGEESYFVVQISDSKKCIIFTNEVIKQMPKGYTNKIEYVRGLLLNEKW